MATRFYLPAEGSVAPPVSPAFDSTWEATGSAFRAITDTTKTGSALASKAIATTLNSPAGAVDVLHAQYVSAPLSGNQTISGNIKGIIRTSENSASADLRAQTVIRVVSGDGSTVRGTLIASSAAALASEFALSTLTNRKFPLAWTGTGATPTTVNALDGDRIVIEVGYRKHENATTSRSGSLNFGDPAGSTDCAENETATTANAPWIEFADTLTFALPSVRASQMVVESLVLPDTAAVRASQFVVEVLYPSSNPTTSATTSFRVIWLD